MTLQELQDLLQANVGPSADLENFDAIRSAILDIKSDIPTEDFVEYHALLSQTSTNPPTESIKKDTLTGGVWSYVSPGYYNYTKAGAFANAARVELIIKSVDLSISAMTNNMIYIFDLDRVDDNTVALSTTKWDWNAGGIYPGTISGTDVFQSYTDGLLYNTPITIRVWSV